MLTRWLAAGLALTLLVAAGSLHGLWAGRWHSSPELFEAAARVAQVPLHVGEWTGQALEGDAASFQQAGALGYWMRTYTDPRSQRSLLVILMCGRAARMAVHTPEICYRGAGYDMLDDPESRAFDAADAGMPDRFWTARFTKPIERGSGLRLYWAWSNGGVWQAAEHPRWEFRREPFLYKLYLSETYVPGDGAGPIAPQFLQEFLPTLRRVLHAHDWNSESTALPECGQGSAG